MVWCDVNLAEIRSEKSNALAVLESPIECHAKSIIVCFELFLTCVDLIEESLLSVDMDCNLVSPIVCPVAGLFHRHKIKQELFKMH